MKIIKFNKNFYNQFQTKIEKRNSLSSKSIQEDVKKIIYDVKKNGDKSLIKYAAKFDKVKISKQDLNLDLSKIKIQSKLSFLRFDDIFGISVIFLFFSKVITSFINWSSSKAWLRFFAREINVIGPKKLAILWQ